MREYRVCKKLILENVNNDSRMKAIALYHILRCNFVNSKVYSLTNASKKIGISSYLLHKLVGVLVETGLAKWVDSYHKRERQQIKVLHLSSIDDIKTTYREKHKTTIRLTHNHSLKDVVFLLKAVCVENYLRQQKYVHKCKTDLKNYSINNLNHYKKLKRVVRSSGEVLKNELYLSSRKAQSLFGINSYDYKSFREFTEKIGWKWIKPQNLVRKCCWEEYCYNPINADIGYHYWTKGYEVIEFPFSVLIS